MVWVSKACTHLTKGSHIKGAAEDEGSLNKCGSSQYLCLRNGLLEAQNVKKFRCAAKKRGAFHCKGGSARKTRSTFFEFSPYHTFLLHLIRSTVEYVSVCMWFAAAHAGAALTPDCEVCLLTDRRFIQVQPSAAAERSAAHPAVCTRRSAACAPLDCRKARMLCLSCVTLAALRPHPNPTTNQPHSRRDPGRVGAMAVPNIVSSCRMEAIAYYGARWARSFVKKAKFGENTPFTPPRPAARAIALRSTQPRTARALGRSGQVWSRHSSFDVRCHHRRVNTVCR